MRATSTMICRSSSSARLELADTAELLPHDFDQRPLPVLQLGDQPVDDLVAAQPA
jgi:hypothetical protein